MRFPYGNPIETGIAAFGQVSDILDRREEAPLRRELMAQDLAERRLRTEAERKRLAFDEKYRAQWEHDTGIKNITAEKVRELGVFLSADAEMEAAKKENRTPKLSEEQKNSLFGVLGDNQLFDPDRIDEQMEGIQSIKMFMQTNGQQLLQGGRLDLEQYPEIEKAVNDTFARQISRGSDRYGYNTDDHRVSKRIKSVYIDPSDQTLVFSLEVETPVEEGQVFKPTGDNPPTYTVNAKAKGIVEKGNIDIANRPAVRNADGSISTVRSISIEEDGKEVLIPTVSKDGKFLSNEQAVAEYRKTGKHLGKFDSTQDANAYAEQLHADQQVRYRQFDAKGQTSTKYRAPLTAGRGAGPEEPVLKVPIPLFDAYLSSNERLGTRIQQLRAEIDPKEYATEIELTKKNRASAAARSKALEKVDTSKPVDDQRKQFVMEYSRLNPDADDKSVIELAKLIIPDKETFGSEAGKQVSDRARLVARYGEGSSEVKAFDQAAATAGDDKGSHVTIYGPDGRTKRVFVRKGEEYTPPKGWSLQAPERQSVLDDMRIASELDKVEGLFVKEYRKGDKEVESIADLDIEEERKEKVQAQVDRALELVRQGRSAAEAKREAMEEIPVSKFKPLTEAAYTRIVEKIKTRDLQEFKEAAEDRAKKMGYDPGEGFKPAHVPKDGGAFGAPPPGIWNRLTGRSIPPRQSTVPAQSRPVEEPRADAGSRLKPITKEVYDAIMAKKPKTRWEAEKMALKMGYDPDEGYDPRKAE